MSVNILNKFLNYFFCKVLYVYNITYKWVHYTQFFYKKLIFFSTEDTKILLYFITLIKSCL